MHKARHEAVIDADCVMLAAGRSERMEHWKMTLPLGNASLIEASVRTALETCARVILVAGYRAAELEELFRGREGVQVIVNSDYEAGMFSSARCGCHQVRSSRFFLALGDMPLVRPETYRALAAFADVLHGGAASASESRAEGGADGRAQSALSAPVPVIIPQFRGKKGHPLLLSFTMRERILSAPPSFTLRDVLVEVPNLVIPVDDPHILHDIDTFEDYGGLPQAES